MNIDNLLFGGEFMPSQNGKKTSKVFKGSSFNLLFEDFNESHKVIRKKTEELQEKELALCFVGIEVLLRIRERLNGMPYEYNTNINALRSLLWRYVVSLPSTAYMCLDSARMGEYRITFSLLRILIEEMVSISYYVENPTLARNEILEYIKKGIVQKPTFRSKLGELKAKSKAEIQGLYSRISEVASHANSMVYVGDLLDEQGNLLIFQEEPNYDEESIINILKLIVRLVYISLTGFIKVFPELLEEKNIRKSVSAFFNNAEKFVVGE